MNIARAVAYLIAGASLTATAQAPVKPPLPVPEMTTPYRSAFAGYRTYIEPDPVPWRRANDDAAAIGGPLGQMAKDVVPSAVARPGAATAAPAKPNAVAPGPAKVSR